MNGSRRNSHNEDDDDDYYRAPNTHSKTVAMDFDNYEDDIIDEEEEIDPELIEQNFRR